MKVTFAVSRVVKNDVFLEVDRPGDLLASGIVNGAGTVKEDMVVTAHLIDENHRDVMFGSQTGEHAVAKGSLVFVKGRRGDVHQQIGTVGGQLVHRVVGVHPTLENIFVVPGIFTDGQSDAQTLVCKGPAALAGLEMAPFIKDVIGRQQLLVDVMENALRFQKEQRHYTDFFRRAPGYGPHTRR